MEVGSFDVGDPLQMANLEDLDFLFANDFELENTGTTVPDNAIQSINVQQDGTNEQPPQKRFKTASDAELKKLQESHQSKSTKKNTKWGVKVFQEWCEEQQGFVLNFEDVSAHDLNTYLCKFYAEATPKSSEKRDQELGSLQAKEYHKNSMKNIRAAVNRHLKDLDRNLDIVRDKEFRKSNEILDGKLKQNLTMGLSRPTKHKEIIPINDIKKIATYLWSAQNPVILRYRVWYDIALHFVTRGLEFHEQLNLNSFAFIQDENGREYASLTHETRQKNWQGGLDSRENFADKRMYASDDPTRCPVASLKCLIEKTDPSASLLFNHISKSALVSPEEEQLWYTKTPVKKYQFSRFMADISKNASCLKNYTPHCLRATAIQGLNDAGYELRHIMYMSGHKNESSVRSYNRDCSTSQKKSLSDTLRHISTASPVVSDQESVVLPVPSSTSSQSVISNTSVEPLSTSTNISSTSFSSSGFISNSSFNNCVFNFTVNVTWEVKNPALIGGPVYLICKIHDTANNCAAKLKQWFGGKYYGKLCFADDCQASTKYRIINNECNYTLEIKYFSVDDIDCDYTCSYGVSNYRKRLTMSEGEFMYTPNTSSEIALNDIHSIGNDLYSFSIEISKVLPKPDYCFAVLEDTRINPVENERKHGIFYQLRLKFSISRRIYTKICATHANVTLQCIPNGFNYSTALTSGNECNGTAKESENRFNRLIVEIPVIVILIIVTAVVWVVVLYRRCPLHMIEYTKKRQDMHNILPSRNVIEMENVSLPKEAEKEPLQSHYSDNVKLSKTVSVSQEIEDLHPSAEKNSFGMDDTTVKDYSSGNDCEDVLLKTANHNTDSELDKNG